METINGNGSLFRGQLVRLTAENPALLAEADARWSSNSEFSRLLNRGPAQIWSTKKITQWIEQDIERDDGQEFFFEVRALKNDCLIGFIGMFGIRWPHGDAMVAIGIGEPEYWGGGYGTEAMRLVLRYAFQELNLYRVTLGVFAYNTRAIRCYEKAGFKHEGREHGTIYRDGERSDVLFMGVLREEWEEQEKKRDTVNLELETAGPR